MLDFMRGYLVKRSEELEQRLAALISGLSDADLNWRPNQASNSIANLTVHIAGHIRQRVGSGMRDVPYVRDREAEFSTSLNLDKSSLLATVSEVFAMLEGTVRQLSDSELLMEQTVSGNRKMTNLEILLRGIEHYSEHLGQMIYIAKQRK
ncbi:DinB family protein [Paenibacillus sp. GCM10023250]|uniref:DinB family protein n=1 Tax=Paenibacillus sp. GCM10023250 TaxID=3252648 RepID=UPI003620ACBC